jgi:hypothetical protein
MAQVLREKHDRGDQLEANQIEKLKVNQQREP